MKRNSKKIMCLCLVATMLCSLTACAGADTKQNVSQNSSSEQADETSGFPFTLTTDGDTQVTFTHVPERVIAANVNAGEELMALGLGDKIIATSCNNEKVAPEYQKEYEAKQSLTEDGQPSLEVVLALNPDFIYGRSSAFGKKGIASHDTLTQNNIMSLSSIESYKMGADIEDVYQDFYNLGKIFNVEDKAQQIVNDMQSKLSTIEEKLKDVKPVKVFDFDMQVEGGAYTCGDNFASNLIAHAGGVNVFKDLEQTWNTVSWEAVVEANPDVIIINDYGDTPLEEKIQQLKTNPALSGLKAVKEERFVAITLPEMFATARAVDTIEKLAKEFHPEIFK